MGLAFDGQSAIAQLGLDSFWQSLVNSGQLDSPEMSFRLRRSASSSDVDGGEFTLGGTNPSLYTGDIEFTDLVDQSVLSSWLLSLGGVFPFCFLTDDCVINGVWKGVTVQGQNVAVASGFSAVSVIDTGSNLIGGPSADVAAIYAAIPGSQSIGDGLYSFRKPLCPNFNFYRTLNADANEACTTNVSIALRFGSKWWPINPPDMNLGLVNSGSSDCVGGIFDLAAGSDIPVGPGYPGWVMGGTFLKNVYSVFRAKPASIGFAAPSP